MSRTTYWRLEGKTIKPSTIEEWAQLMNDGDSRRMAWDQMGDVGISTVFLGLDHNFDPDGPPLVFETMIFGGPNDQHEWRYSTWAAAMNGHKRVVLAEQRRIDGD